MAIDTVTKRASVMNFTTGALLPVPDGTIDQGDRQTLLQLYSGILAGAAEEVTEFGGNLWIVMGWD